MIVETFKDLSKTLLITTVVVALCGGIAYLLISVLPPIPVSNLWLLIAIFAIVEMCILFFLAYFKKKPFKSEFVDEIYKDRLSFKTDGEFIIARRGRIIKLMDLEEKHYKILKEKDDIKLNVLDTTKALPDKTI